MVYTERAETAAVSCGTSHVESKQRRKYTTSVDIVQNALKKQKSTVTHPVTCKKSAVSLLRSGEQRYTKGTNNFLLREPVWPSGKALGW